MWSFYMKNKIERYYVAGIVKENDIACKSLAGLPSTHNFK